MRRFLLLCCALLAPVPVAAQDPVLRLAGVESRTVAGVRVAGAAAFPLSALEAFGAAVRSDDIGARAVLFGDTIQLFAGSPFIRTRSAAHQLAFPVERSAAAVLVPEQFFIEWMPRTYPDEVEYRDGTLRLKRATVASQDAQARAPVSASEPASASAPLPLPLPAKSGAETRVVVIDPGHGGVDPGKVGARGLAEKDVVLAIGRRLAALLRERGFEVHLTRDRDTLIALADRPRLANQWKGARQRAVFVSIHANAWQPSARGFETFFLSDARTEDARRVAEMENAAVAYEEPAESGPEADLILNSLRNDFYVRASNDLAEVVQGHLARFHSGPNRGVKQAAFDVLVGAFMPAVLVETAFISNPEEGRLLSTADFQQKLAYGMAEAIEEFFVQHEYLWTAGSE